MKGRRIIMKNKSRVVSILLTLAQIVISAMTIILAVHDLFVTEAQTIIPFIDGNARMLYILMAIMGISLIVSIIAMVVAVKWKNPKTIFGVGIASIFGFNLGAGLVMALSADKK